MAVDKVIEKKLNSFFSKFNKQTYKKGETLIRANENPKGIFYVKEGLVREYAISKEGEEVVLNVFKKGSFFPMSWAITEVDNRYFFEALINTVIVKAPKDKVLQFVQGNVDILYDLLNRVYVGTDGLLQRLEYLMTEGAYRQLIFELILHSKRFGKKERNSYSFELTEGEIASNTGMARETISRELKKIRNKKLIKYNKKLFVIPDLQKLKNEL